MGDKPALELARACAQTCEVIGSSRGVDDVLRVVGRVASELLGTERGTLVLRGESKHSVDGAHGGDGARPLPTAARPSRDPTDDELMQLVLTTKRTVVIDDGRSDPRVRRGNANIRSSRVVLAVPLMLDDEAIGVLYLHSVHAPHSFTTEQVELACGFAAFAAVAIARAREMVDLLRADEAADRQIDALRRSAVVVEKLGDLVLADRSLDDLVQTLATLLGKPCALHDVDDRLMAAADPRAVSDGIMPSLLRPPGTREPSVRRALTHEAGDRVVLVSPLREAGVMHRHLVAPVRIGSTLCARLVVMEYGSRFSAGDMLAVRRAATLIALKLRDRGRKGEAAPEKRGELVAELLGGVPSAAASRERAQRAGLNPAARHVAVVIRPRTGLGRGGDFGAIAAELQKLAPYAVHAATQHDEVLALVEVPEEAGENPETQIKALVTAVCERGERRRHVIGGVSGACSDTAELSAVGRAAREVCECVCRFGREGGPSVLCVDDLGRARALLSDASPRTVTSFAQETLGGLLRDPANSSLLATLSCFFECAASISRCASILGVHDNTIRYRLARMEELTGLSIAHDSDDQFAARLALTILRLQGIVLDGGKESAPAGGAECWTSPQSTRGREGARSVTLQDRRPQRNGKRTHQARSDNDPAGLSL
ncbi:MAG TPA: GAF domain-containing protein [Solirubrobacteraceae bacterium]|nr:GAF domain-containing protein [Solirubrobacteraceae bacterium]